MRALWITAVFVGACGDDPAQPHADATTADTTASDSTATTSDTTETDTTPTRASDRTLQVMTALNAEPCDLDESFLCATIQVPLDHDNPSGPTIPIGFAVRPADTSPPRGLLMNIAGGPGESGLESLDDYSSVSERFADELDIAYFDLRSVGASDGNYVCPDALLALYDGGFHVSSTGSESDVVARADAFGPACLTEMGLDAQKAALYSTVQAAEDIEAIRATLEHAQMRVYGLSYGTQLGQIYTAAHPDRVEALVIDGVVDLTSTLIEFDAALARTSNDLLTRTFAACDAEVDCSEALGGDAAGAWDDIRAMLPMDIDFTVDDEDFTYRLRQSALDTIAGAYMGNPDDRRAFLQLLEAVVVDEDWEALLFAYMDSEGIDYDGSVLESEDSESIYFLVSCADYGRPDRAAYLAAGQTFWDERVTTAFYGDIACLNWPVAIGSSVPVATLGVPTLIINADGDMLTPHEGGAAVAQRNADAAVIEVTGGEHVMYGWGDSCVDDAANAFLLDLTKPTTRPLNCPDIFLSEP